MSDDLEEGLRRGKALEQLTHATKTWVVAVNLATLVHFPPAMTREASQILNETDRQQWDHLWQVYTTMLAEFDGMRLRVEKSLFPQSDPPPPPFPQN
jgi:hypothetical protein